MAPLAHRVRQTRPKLRGQHVYGKVYVHVCRRTKADMKLVTMRPATDAMPRFAPLTYSLLRQGQLGQNRSPRVTRSRVPDRAHSTAVAPPRNGPAPANEGARTPYTPPLPPNPHAPPPCP